MLCAEQRVSPANTGAFGTVAAPKAVGTANHACTATSSIALPHAHSTTSTAPWRATALSRVSGTYRQCLRQLFTSNAAAAKSRTSAGELVWRARNCQCSPPHATSVGGENEIIEMMNEFEILVNVNHMCNSGRGIRVCFPAPKATGSSGHGGLGGLGWPGSASPCHAGPAAQRRRRACRLGSASLSV